MTREEAIKALNEYGTLFPSDKSEAIDIAIMAIEALQTPPISQRSMYPNCGAKMDGERREK